MVPERNGSTLRPDLRKSAPTVVVTGGCGYIGIHTIVELVKAGYEVVSIDSNVRSSRALLDGVERITGRRVINLRVDLRDARLAARAFAGIPRPFAVIHFAALKSAPESLVNPLLYYDNNLNSLRNVLRAASGVSARHFIFSSSASVYGKPRREKFRPSLFTLPVTEETELGEAESPYARTKQIGETMIRDHARTDPAMSFVSLRYFNPAGAHSSGEIGEVPWGPEGARTRPDNLVPAITQFAAGRLPELIIHGADYETRDGTCLRDFIHVSDIAQAHVKALQFLVTRPLRPSPLITCHRIRDKGEGMRDEFRPSPFALRPSLVVSPANYDIFNLGSGTGTTVLEAIRAFERVTAQKLRYRIGPRRPGDLPALYADSTKAERVLGWRPKHGIDDIMLSAWRWEVKRNEPQRTQEDQPRVRTTTEITEKAQRVLRIPSVSSVVRKGEGIGDEG
jgi:UDP-glucose 4-epimerase